MIDILVVGFLIYQFIMFVRGRRAAHILTGLATLVGLYGIAVWMRLDLLRSILAYLAPYTAFGLIVMFQGELRNLLARIGRRRWLSFQGRLQNREFVDEIMLAVSTLTQEQTGALIVLERDIGLRTFIESGIALDACLSRDLLLAIFQKNGPLHDGAAIIQGTRVAAAACFLPLSTNPQVIQTLGTRHRAAIGVTEETDCLALVVSEETGHVSIATFGELAENLTLPEAEQRMLRHFEKRQKAPNPVESVEPLEVGHTEDLQRP